MDFQKTALSLSIGLALGMVDHAANASLTTSATLDFALGTVQVVACTYGTAPPCLEHKGSFLYQITDIVGSYFGVDTDGSDSIEADEKVPIGSLNGIHIGTTQLASGSHSGSINGSENPNIDSPWTFFGNTGMHQTTSPIVDLTGSGAVRTLDFSGWGWDWNGLDTVPMLDLGTTLTCDTTTCADGSTYVLDGTFQINGQGITTVSYVLHLEGTISSVPVPAAAWLFGSGVAGLVGVARRRKSAR